MNNPIFDSIPKHTDCRLNRSAVLIGEARAVDDLVAWQAPHICDDAEPCDSRKAQDAQRAPVADEVIVDGFLTAAEHEWINASATMWNNLCALVGNGPSRDADLAELSGHLHGLQRAVLANAAARAHPRLYRTLGGTVG